VRGERVLCSLFVLFGLGCGLFGRGAGAGAGGNAPPGAPRVTQGELDASGLLGDTPARATRLGAGPGSMVASGMVARDSWVGGFVDVPLDACLLGYARGSESIDDVDVVAYSDEGAMLAVDEAKDPRPTVLLCPPHPDRVYLAAHVAEGVGLVAVGAQVVPRDRALVVGRALGARGLPGEGPRPADVWPGLEEQVRARRQALGGKWEELKREILSVDSLAPTLFGLPIEADQCVDATILPDDDVALLDVEALDGEGRVVARAREGSGVRTLTVCSPTAMPGSLSIRPHFGRGLVAIVLARARGEVARDVSAVPDIAWAAATQPVETARSARNELLAKSGYDAPVATTTGALALGRRLSVPLDLKPFSGGCARIDVVAGAPLGLVSARVWDDAGALVASAEASTSVALFACGRGTARLDLETRGRPGPFAMMVRPERWKDAAFGAHPLAASRMLGRSTVGPEMLLEGKDRPARAVALDPSHVETWNESVPAGKCVRASMGAQGDGAGLELRVFDAADGTELDRSEAAHAVSARACAGPDAPRAVRFEARASAGKVDAVVGERGP
jgi:hypothetical protein